MLKHKFIKSARKTSLLVCLIDRHKKWRDRNSLDPSDHGSAYGTLKNDETEWDFTIKASQVNYNTVVR